MIYWCDSGEAYGPGMALLCGGPDRRDPAVVEAEHGRMLDRWQAMSDADLRRMAVELDRARGEVGRG